MQDTRYMILIEMQPTQNITTLDSINIRSSKTYQQGSEFSHKNIVLHLYFYLRRGQRTV